MSEAMRWSFPAALVGLVAACSAWTQMASAAAVLDSNGSFVGAFLGELSPMARSQADSMLVRRSEVATATGFSSVVDLDSGAVRSVFKVCCQSNDCSGQGYAELVGAGFLGEAPLRGFVFGSDDSLSLDPVAFFYVPRDAQIDTSGAFSFGSSRGLDGACGVRNGFNDKPMIEILDNDPAVTGFDPTTWVPPFTVVLNSGLFRDGFESAA